MEANRKVLVKNRAPAPVQITAEQILREANDRIEKSEKGPRTTITDAEELMQVNPRGVSKNMDVWKKGHDLCSVLMVYVTDKALIVVIVGEE